MEESRDRPNKIALENRLTSDILKGFTKKMAERDGCQVSCQTNDLQKESKEAKKRFEKLLSDRNELIKHCMELEEKVNQLKKEKVEELRCIQMENKQLQIALENRLTSDVPKGFTKQMAERDGCHRFELCQTERGVERQSIDQVEMFQKQVSCQTNDLQKESKEGEKRFEKFLSDRNELTEHCLKLEEKVDQLKKEKMEELQYIQMENKQLQNALHKSKLTRDALKKESTKQLAERDERHRHELSLREKDVERQLSEKEEMFQKQLSSQTNHSKMALKERDKRFEEFLSDRNELIKHCMELDEKVNQLKKKKAEELRCIQKENNQLQNNSKLTCKALTEEFTEQLAQRDQHHLLELSQREKCFQWQLSEKADMFQRQLCSQSNHFEMEMKERDKRIEKLLDELPERCVKLEEKVDQVKKEKMEELQCIQTEKNQLQNNSRLTHDALKEEFNKQLAERDERHRLELSLREKDVERQLLEKEEMFQKQLSSQTNHLKMELKEGDKRFEKLLSDKNELSERCVKLEEKVDQLKREKVEELQYIQMENNQLQNVLGNSKLMCDALKEEFTKQLAKKNVEHLLELSQREKDVERQWSEQMDHSIKQVSDKNETLENKVREEHERFEELLSEKNELSERCVKLEEKVDQLKKEKAEELQCIQTEKNQLQDALDNSELQCDALKEEFTKQLAQRDERHKQEPSQQRESYKRLISENNEISKKQRAKQEKTFKEVISNANELSEHCVKLGERIDQLQKEKTELHCFKTENEQKKKKWFFLFRSAKKGKDGGAPKYADGGQAAMKVLDTGKLMCDALKELTEKLAKTEKNHRLYLLQREKDVEGQLSEQMDHSIKQDSDKTETLENKARVEHKRVEKLLSEKNELSERCVKLEERVD